MDRSSKGKRPERSTKRLERTTTSLKAITLMEQMGGSSSDFDWQKNSWVTDFKIFASTTTAHGVNQIFVGRNKFIRLMFLLAWIGCLVYTISMIMAAVVTFVNKPTGTKYEVIVDQPDKEKPQIIKFPTITVCSANKVKKSFLENEENTQIAEFWKGLGMNELNSPSFNWTKPEWKAVENTTYQEFLIGGAPQDDRLVFCEARANHCMMLLHGDHYFVRDKSLTGVCWRINPDGLLEGKSGDYGKLRIIMFADLKDYGPSSVTDPQHGFTVAFHDHKIYGSTLNSGYYISPSTVYKVDLRLKKEKREPPPGGNCNVSLIDTSYGAYHEGSCTMECQDRYMYDRCGCVGVVPPINDKLQYKPCTIKQWAECGYNAYMKFVGEYRDPKYTLNICPCQSACKETYYEAQLSSSALSKQYAKFLYNKTFIRNILESFSKPEMDIVYDSVEDIYDNIVVLEIIFSNMATSEIQQVVTYTSANLLGDIGGVLGLFLGASVFTVIEFFQLFVFAVQKHCFGRCGDKEEEEAMKDNWTIKEEEEEGVELEKEKKTTI